MEAGLWELGCGSETVGAGLCPRRPHRDLPALPRRLLRGQSPLPQGGGRGTAFGLWERVAAREGLTAICLPYRVAFFAGRAHSHKGSGARHRSVGAELWERVSAREGLTAICLPYRVAFFAGRARSHKGGAGHGIWSVVFGLWERVSAREGLTAVCLPYRVVFFAGRGLGRPPRSHLEGGGGPIGCLRVNIAALFILYVGCP